MEHARDLLWFFVLLTLGVMTKSVRAPALVPGLGIFLLLQKRATAFFMERKTYIGMGIFLLVVGAFYLLRE